MPGHLRPAEGLGEEDIGDTEFIGHQPTLTTEAALKCLESTLEFPLGCLLDGITALVHRQREGVLGQCPQRLLKLGGQETEPLIHLCLPGQRLWQQAPFSRRQVATDGAGLEQGQLTIHQGWRLAIGMNGQVFRAVPLTGLQIQTMNPVIEPQFLERPGDPQRAGIRVAVESQHGRAHSVALRW